MRCFLLLFCLITSLESYCQFEETSFKRIVNKIDELEHENEKYINQINELNGFLRLYENQKGKSKREEERLKKAVERQAEEIVMLTSKLRENESTINQMLEEILFLEGTNSEYTNIIDTLRQDSIKAHLQLDSTATLVKNLMQDLEDSRFANEIQRAENSALTATIEGMLDIKRNIHFISISTMSYNGFEASIERGNITKLDNLYTGGKVSYSGFTSSSTNGLLEIISVNALIKYTLFGSSFSFKLVDPEVPLLERATYFISLDFGWSQPVRRINVQNYSGGINWHLSGGIALPFTNSVNPYLAIGVKREAFDYNVDNRITGEGSSYLAYLSVGVNF